MNSLKFQAGLLLVAALAAAQPAAVHFNSEEGQQFLRTKCGACHGGKAAAGGFQIAKLAGPDSFRERSELWTKARLRVYRLGAGEPAEHRVRGGHRARTGAGAPLESISVHGDGTRSSQRPRGYWGHTAGR